MHALGVKMVLARQVAVCSGASQAGCTCSVPFPAAGQVRFVALWGDCASPEFAECLGVAKCTLGVKVLLAREVAVCNVRFPAAVEVRFVALDRQKLLIF